MSSRSLLREKTCFGKTLQENKRLEKLEFIAVNTSSYCFKQKSIRFANHWAHFQSEVRLLTNNYSISVVVMPVRIIFQRNLWKKKEEKCVFYVLDKKLRNGLDYAMDKWRCMNGGLH